MSVSGSTDSESPGVLGGAKKAIGDKLDQFLDLPDKPKKEWQRKLAYIAFDLGVLLLVFGMASMMFGGVNPVHWISSLQNPSIMNMMSLPMLVAGGGVGLAFLIKDILPKKAHRTAGRVMAIAAPILILGGAIALILAGGKTGGGHLLNYHFSFTKSMTSPYFYIGLLLLPLSVYAFDRACGLKKSVPVLRGRLPVRPGQRRNRPLSGQRRLARVQRNEEIRRDRETEIQRTHRHSST